MRIGIDLGGTKIEGIALADGGTTLASKRIDTPRGGYVPGIAESVAEQMSRWVFSDTVTTRVVRHMHGDASGVRGAAWLWRVGEV